MHSSLVLEVLENQDNSEEFVQIQYQRSSFLNKFKGILFLPKWLFL